MPDINSYLSQGVDAASSARDSVSYNWADSWKNFATQYALAAMQNDWNVRNTEAEFARNLQMWNLNNEYNSPASQMARFKAAGLNPMLVYSQGSPGNSSSPVSVPSYKPAAGVNADIHPNQDRAAQIASAANAIGMVTNVTQNIAGLLDAGMNLKLKQNEVYQSNLDRYFAEHTFGSVGSTGINMAQPYLSAALNPLSDQFDPLAFMTFQKHGKLPGFINQFMIDDIRRNLLGNQDLFTRYRADYQKYYNEHLLPKFNEYQQGKIDLQEIEKELENYHKTSLEMIPPELRGILEPLIGYLSPFIKFIFKRSSGTFNHTVQ